jgi:hypothetical protein
MPDDHRFREHPHGPAPQPPDAEATALQRYGDHASRCRKKSGGDRCNCGFQEALDLAAQAPDLQAEVERLTEYEAAFRKVLGEKVTLAYEAADLRDSRGQAERERDALREALHEFHNEVTAQDRRLGSAGCQDCAALAPKEATE